MAIQTKTLTGYFETEYASEWPGLVTNRPSNRIPPGACISCNAQVVRGRLTPQPTPIPITGSVLPVTLPTFAANENICYITQLNRPGTQIAFWVVITNVGVYIDYIVPTASATSKTLTKIFTFPTPYPRYAHFGVCTIGSALWFSSASQLGVYALRPTFTIVGATITNPGGYFTGTPSGFIWGGGGTSGVVFATTVSGGNLTSVSVGATSGTGYVSPPNISFSGGTTTGPTNGQSFASAVAILSSYPTAYEVTEMSASTGVANVITTSAGTGYTQPQVIFQGGGGTGATGTAVLNGSGGIAYVIVDSQGQNYTSAPSVEVIDTQGGAGYAGTAELFMGKPFVGGDFLATMSERLILANIIGDDGNTTVPLAGFFIANGGTGYLNTDTIDIVGGGGSGFAGTISESGGVITGINVTNWGNGFYGTPQVNIISNTGTGAQIYAYLSQIPEANSSTTPHPDWAAWSAPNDPSSFDPNYGTAPGGNNVITEAQGILTSANVVESTCFLGHNGGITEMTPNTSSALTPFSFYPLWSAEKGVLVRYGSMAQYGSTLCFLSSDSAYTMTPNGLTEIGQNIANQLQNYSTWNDGSFPLQGLYGSIVLIEGEKHYLIAFSADNTPTRNSMVYDFNMNESNWHSWTYGGITFTCPIAQVFDTAAYVSGLQTVIARDAWIVSSWTSGTLSDTATLVDLAPLNRYIATLPNSPFQTPNFAYGFRTESPAIARMQSERRFAFEYENEPALEAQSVTPILNFYYTGQEDPTTQTGIVSQQQTTTYEMTYLPVNAINTVPNQILTAQVDFSTFTGVCTELTIGGLGSNALVSLVRFTQVAELMKGQIT